MSSKPLALSLIALTVAFIVVVLPAGATHPGDNGKIVFERPTPNGTNLFTVNPNGSKRPAYRVFAKKSRKHR